MSKPSTDEGVKVVVQNRKARHDFFIEKSLEAGIALLGSEVKSLRDGKGNLQDAFCAIDGGDVYLRNAHISPYKFGTYFNHDPLRPRRLLLHRREIAMLRKATVQKGYTIVPLKIYFKRGIAKVEIGLARGKKQYDKRADIARREEERRLQRISRGARPE